MTSAPVPFRVLGPVAVVAADGPVLLPPQEHLVVSALLAVRGTPVTRDTLSDLLYGRPDPPDSLAQNVFELGERLRDRGLPWTVHRSAFRWNLHLPDGAVDADALATWTAVPQDAARDGLVPQEVGRLLAGREHLVLARPFDALVHPWFEPHREELARRQAEAIVQFAQDCVEAASPVLPLPLLAAAVDREHLRGHRDLWEHLAVCHLGAGDPDEALAAADRGSTLMAAAGRTADARWLTGLERRISDRERTLLLRAAGYRAGTPLVRTYATAPPLGDVRLGVLGPLRLEVDGLPRTPARTEDRLVLARLAVDAGRPVAGFELWSVATGSVETPGRAALHLARVARDLGSALGDAVPGRLTLEDRRTAWTLHAAPGVLDLETFRSERNAAMDALDAGRPDVAEARLSAAAALFARPALEGLTGRWAAAERERLEVEALEVHMVLANRLRTTAPDVHADRIAALHARFPAPSTTLWAALLRDRLDAGADDALGALVREAPYALGRLADDDPQVRDLLFLARRHLAAGGAAALGTGWVFRRELRLFGPFRLLVDGADRTPADPVEAAVLAALAVRRDRTVPWQDLARAARPDVPVDDLREDVRRAALALADLGSAEPPRFEVARPPDGWALLLPDPCTDLDRVEALVSTGTELLTQGRAREAVVPLEVAASLTARPALDDLTSTWFDGPRRQLEGVARHAATTLATALVDGVLAGRGGDRAGALVRLEGLVARHPDVPALRERLMTGYHLCGRDRDAEAVHEAALELGLPAVAGPARAMRDLRAAIDAAGTGTATSQVSFRVLDGVVVEVLGRERRPRPRTRRVLAALLLRRGTVLTPADVAATVGDLPDDGSATARRVVDEAVTEVDELTQPRWGTPDAAEASTRRAPLSVRAVPGGWVATVPDRALDLALAADLAARGTADLRQGRTTDAADRLRRAARLLPADPLPDGDGPWFAADRARLLAWRADVVRSCVAAEVACGRYAEALSDLERLAAADPADETLAADLVTALAALGRRADARAAYDRCATALRRTLGSSPGPTLQMLVRSRLGD